MQATRPYQRPWLTLFAPEDQQSWGLAAPLLSYHRLRWRLAGVQGQEEAMVEQVIPLVNTH
jgi:hypothetical protein